MSTTATVTTLEVSVKVIRIGAKQCTQAVFRQLDEKPFDVEHGTLWGRVSYCPQPRSRYSDHACLNLVWSDGTALYRSHQTMPDYELRCPSAHDYAPPDPPPYFKYPLIDTKWSDNLRYRTTDELRDLLAADPDHHEWVRQKLFESKRGQDAWPEHLEKHRSNWDKAWADYRRSETAWRRWNSYLALDLLFIAV